MDIHKDVAFNITGGTYELIFDIKRPLTTTL